MRPLTVLFVINGLGTGGAERSLAEMLPVFVREGLRPIVATLWHRFEGVEDSVRAEGCDVRLVDAERWPTRIRELRALIHLESVDLVHTALFEADITGRLAAWGTQVPVVTSLVTPPYVRERARDPHVGRTKLAAVRLIDGWTARHLTTHFHAISNTVKDAAIGSLGVSPRRITVIRRGRSPARLGAPDWSRRRKARAALNLSEEDEVVISVGRHEWAKGQRYLLRALAHLHRERLILIVAGRDGHETGLLRQIASDYGLEERVRFLGHREDVPDLLCASDVFVLPSMYEGFGGAVIEAMALGLPVVASDLGAVREVVEDGTSGLLVPPGSPEALARAIDELLDAPGNRRAMGARGRRIFEESFTLEQSALQMVGLYRSLVHRGSERPVPAGSS